MGLIPTISSASSMMNPSAVAMQMGGSMTGIGEGGGGGGMMSDEDKKNFLKEKDELVHAFLDALEPYQFEYKNEKHGKGKKYGVMAQDLEKSKVGESIVKETDEGKQIDIASGLGTTLAALGYIHERLKQLEKKNGRGK